MREPKEKGVKCWPVDTEHNAIFQCLVWQRENGVRRLI